MLGYTNFIEGDEESLIYVSFNAEQEGITTRSAKIWKCEKQTK